MIYGTFLKQGLVGRSGFTALFWNAAGASIITNTMVPYSLMLTWLSYHIPEMYLKMIPVIMLTLTVLKAERPSSPEKKDLGLGL